MDPKFNNRRINNFKIIQKMKTISFLVVALVIFSSCNKKQSEVETEQKFLTSDTVSDSQTTISTFQSNVNKNIFGYYTGEFIAVKYKEGSDYTHINKITIFLDSAVNDLIYGHSVVAGNERPFKGNYKSGNDNYIVSAVEPGDDKYDGKFNFTVYPGSNSLEGTWNSFDKNLLVTEREYNLNKTRFSYNADIELPEDVSWALLYNTDNYLPTEGRRGEFLTNDVLKVNASKKLLSRQDVENMHKGDLEIIRNSIYARHGYSFKTRKIRYIFDRYVDWYMPFSTDVRDKLTEIEQKNIALLKRYEEHAEKYYDEFGR
jgi:hypothetical protein